MSNYYHNSGNNKGTNNLGNSSHSAAGNGKAHAPYNFVPLNEKVVKSEWETWKGLPPFDRYNKDTLSGTIQISLTTKTPLYIRDMKPKIEDDNPVTFFGKSIGEARIPGSSIRGMIRNLVEIASYGKFKNFEDKTLYYRGLADKSSLRKEYQKNMSTGIGPSAKYLFKAGYISKNDDQYYIIPAEVDNNNRQFCQVKKRNFKDEFIYVRQPDGKCVVVSGNMGNKKRDWLINAPDTSVEKINIPEVDIDNYKKDKTRFVDKNLKMQNRRDGDLLRQIEIADRTNNLVPCFYLCWRDNKGKDRVSFGHTGYYRLAYRLSIADHVPNLSENEKPEPDITEAIFGDKDHASSRVYFEDLPLDSKIKEEIFENRAFLKVLSSPKPTTFQHYLEQQDKSNPKALKHWNSINTRIRGYKLYWHRNTPRTGDHSWSESEVVEEGDTQHTIVTPVKPGIVFKGAIRFENLSPIELGALLFVLKLPENHYHKLGMGKPLGLGSVKIETSVSLSDRNSVSGRYTKLFSDNSWHLGNNDADDKIKGWISEFERFVLNAIEPSKGNGKLWDTERMKKLKKMLDFGNTQKQNWNEKTRYMQITPVNEFKDRKVLPEPEEV